MARASSVPCTIRTNARHGQSPAIIAIFCRNGPARIHFKNGARKWPVNLKEMARDSQRKTAPKGARHFRNISWGSVSRAHRVLCEPGASRAAIGTIDDDVGFGELPAGSRDSHHAEWSISGLVLPGKTMRREQELDMNAQEREIDPPRMKPICFQTKDATRRPADLDGPIFTCPLATSTGGLAAIRRRPDSAGRTVFDRPLSGELQRRALETIPDRRQYARRGVDDLKRLLSLARRHGEVSALVG
jgi:hypothetical protein